MLIVTVKSKKDMKRHQSGNVRDYKLYICMYLKNKNNLMLQLSVCSFTNTCCIYIIARIKTLGQNYKIQMFKSLFS